jgi:glycine/D-amino acid oxidase-like deaminating enzyme
MEPHQQELSFWELKALGGPWDFVVVGCGVTGLHAGIELKKQQPRLKVLILENRILGAVASTRNAGFLCLGSPSEIQADQLKLGENGLIELLSTKWAGIQRTLHLLGGKAIGLRNVQGYEVMARDHSRFGRAIPQPETVLSDLHRLNEIMAHASANPVPFTSRRRAKGSPLHQSIPAPYFGSWMPFAETNSDKPSPWGPEAAGRIPIAWEGQVNPFLVRESLLRYARNLGIRIQEGLQVIPAGPQRLSLSSASTKTSENFSISTNLLDINANCIIYATNALTQLLIPDLSPAIIPQRGQMWVSSPLNPADLVRLNGNFHADRGYLYYRTYDGRLLLGGGRNQDLDSEQTTDWFENELISDYLKAYGVEVLGLPEDMPWELRWSGTMGFTQSGIPKCLQLPEGEWLVAGMNGMGMALGPEMGRRVAQMALQSR